MAMGVLAEQIHTLSQETSGRVTSIGEDLHCILDHASNLKDCTAPVSQRRAEEGLQMVEDLKRMLPLLRKLDVEAITLLDRIETEKSVHFGREVHAKRADIVIFKDDKIIHVENKIDPLQDIGVINLELVLADLETVTKRLASIQKDVKAHKKEAILEDNLLQRVRKILEEGKLANGILLHDDEKPILKQLNLLSVKPILYVLNSSEAGENDETILSKIPGVFVRVDPVFENGLNDLIKKSYEILDLITYFTTGEDETRAWTIKRGSTAPEAGAAIHTDFREKFIKAEVIEWEKLLAGGLTRTEGKNYLVQDGDVIEFRI